MNTEEKLSARKWWWLNRCKYNRALILSGFIAFLLYCTLGPIFIAPHTEFEETLFEMAFQGIFYGFMMVLANVFYTSGWLIDLLFNKSNSEPFRRRLFALGYWFSFALPISLILWVMLRFLIWGK